MRRRSPARSARPSASRRATAPSSMSRRRTGRPPSAPRSMRSSRPSPRSRGARIAYVANRSPGRAAGLAERVGAEALPLAEIEERLAEADVVVSSTSAPGYVLTRETVERARGGRPLLLIDLAVPRDLDPSLQQPDCCSLYASDATAAVLARKRAEDSRALADGAAATRAGAVGVRARSSAWRAQLRADEDGARRLC